MPIALIQLFLQLIAAGISIAPSVYEAAKAAIDLLRPGAAPPTPTQQAMIDAALEEANNALQAAQPAP